MVYRLPNKRITLDLDGPTVEVERLLAAPIQQIGVRKFGQYLAAQTPEKQLAALIELYEFVVHESQLTWDIADHLGPLPQTATGMARLPVLLGIDIATGWLGTFAAEEAKPASAVDAVIPPGPLRNEVQRRLRAVKKVA